MTWQQFVAEYGWRARGDHLAHVLGQPEPAITRLRSASVCKKGLIRSFVDLFALWHGRPPSDEDWPPPRRGPSGRYEWQPPELALVASLVGTVGPKAIEEALTARLRRVTGDPTAVRSHHAVLCAIHRTGLQTADVVGGITIADAAREIGTRAILNHEIRLGRLQTMQVGRYLVIPHETWAQWKAARVLPPAGFIRLATLRKQLGIKSDKLSEYARDGYIPTAVRCNPYGTRERSTRFGTWFIDSKVAKKILVDRRAGRAMPWHGKPYAGNLNTTWKRWRSRQHPAECVACRDIWGTEGPPRSFDDYVVRYPPLAHGAKRHLTRPWSPGLSLDEIVRQTATSRATVVRAIARGTLRARTVRGAWRATQTDVTRWRTRRCPTGEAPYSWIALDPARRQYAFTVDELRELIASGRLRSKVGTHGAMRGITYVLKQQLRELRDELGYTEAAAARRAGVSVARLRVLLRGLEWRPAPQIPVDVVNAVVKRQESCEGVTVAEAAKILGKPVSWIEQEIRAGTVHPLRTKWNRRRRYISFPMFKRLADVALDPPPRQRWSSEWLLLSDATHLAGVSPTTLMRWAEAGEVVRRMRSATWRYHRRSVMTRARDYWKTVRFKRAIRPEWLQTEEAA